MSSSKPGSVLRIVVDTNVLFSAALSPENLPKEIIELVLQGMCVNYVSPSILIEIEEVCVGEPTMRDLALLFTSRSVCIDSPEVRLCRDPDDNKFLACALEAHAILVTGDKDLLVLDGQLPIRIVTPRAFLTYFKNS